MSDMIKVMVVDDTITYRQILSKVVEGFSNADLVGTASGGKTALMKIPSQKPDLIFLDVMMPDMDGIETLREIKAQFPQIQVVMVSAFDMANAKATIDSLQLGALDFVAKPMAENMQDGIHQLQVALTPLIGLVHEQVFGKEAPKTKPKEKTVVPEKPKAKTAAPKGKIDFILIGISTGGPNALHELFKQFPAKLECPVLIVQHMPPMFTQSLAERLDSIGIMSVVEAQEGEIPENGKVYIAPGGKHMVLRKKSAGMYQIGVVDSPPVNHCKPAVDVLFRSVASIQEIDSLAVVMTGMGRDGTEGVKTLKRKGTYCLAQDEKSSVVWGMPGSICEAQLADEVLPLKELAGRIHSITSRS